MTLLSVIALIAVGICVFVLSALLIMPGMFKRYTRITPHRAVLFWYWSISLAAFISLHIIIFGTLSPQMVASSALGTSTATISPATPSSPLDGFYAIERVIDGDTVTIRMNDALVHVRLIGVNAPEISHPNGTAECFGAEAAQYAKTALAGKRVHLQTDATQDTYDKYGRLLGYLFMEDGTNFNLQLIQNGYAHEYTHIGVPYRYQTEFKRAQDAAEASQTGLWAPDACVNIAQSNTLLTAPADTSNKQTGYYTSSHPTATRYYPASCSAWQKLSKNNLEYFETLDELLARYSRTPSPLCN